MNEMVVYNCGWMRVLGLDLMFRLVVINATSHFYFYWNVASSPHFLTALAVRKEFNLLDTMKKVEKLPARVILSYSTIS